MWQYDNWSNGGSIAQVHVSALKSDAIKSEKVVLQELVDRPRWIHTHSSVICVRLYRLWMRSHHPLDQKLIVGHVRRVGSVASVKIKYLEIYNFKCNNSCINNQVAFNGSIIVWFWFATSGAGFPVNVINPQVKVLTLMHDKYCGRDFSWHCSEPRNKEESLTVSNIWGLLEKFSCSYSCISGSYHLLKKKHVFSLINI